MTTKCRNVYLIFCAGNFVAARPSHVKALQFVNGCLLGAIERKAEQAPEYVIRKERVNP